jgi:3-deoxy-manno-octulosonate cytidylyltransferase (CMP-KDO synthetase)
VQNKSKQAIAIIPARYGSSRLEGKPLIKILGKPLIQWVWEAAAHSTMLRDIIIATDDDRIMEECFMFGASCIMTPDVLPSGSDRVFWAYKELKEFADLIINIQGDEPLITPELIDSLIKSMLDTNAEVGTFIKKIKTYEELQDPAVVKVALSNKNQAMYFSRSPIPFVRGVPTEQWLQSRTFWKHIGIYAYQPHTLWKYVHFQSTDLEETEKLEQLRLLQNEIPINCFETNIDLIGVDTKEDVLRAEKALLERV